MRLANTLEMIEASEICRQRLLQKGITVELTTDFTQIQKDAFGLNKPYFTRQLSSQFHEFTTENAFWFRIYHGSKPSDRTLIGLVGGRKDVIAPHEFIPLIERQAKRLFGGGEAVPFASKVYPPVFERMSGTVVYIGDLFVEEQHRGRSKFDKRALLLLLFITAQLKWSFDWLYAFVREEHGERGYLVTYGFTHVYLAALLWSNPPPERSNTDLLACIDRADISYTVRRLLDVPDIL